MPDLIHSLLNQDIGHLRIIAELWGLELDSTDADSARDELSASLLDFNLLADHLASLPPKADSALAALAALIASNGRIAWATFARQFGDIREMGAGKRDREHPHRNPISTSEILFYRGILARAFFDTDKGSQEFAYIPDDLLVLLSRMGKKEESDALSSSKGGKNLANFAGLAVTNSEPLGRPASPNEKGKEILADDSILDDATTIIAALRVYMKPPETTIPNTVIWHFLIEADIASLSSNTSLSPENVKKFLEASRVDALNMLIEAWKSSHMLYELFLIPTLVYTGDWNYEPRVARNFLLQQLDVIPKGKWWSLNAFVQDIKQKHPDFQRPAGDYDSWFITRASDGQFLRGFESWDEVDGALIRFFITKIMHWLGQIDLSFAEGTAEATAFRIKSKVEGDTQSSSKGQRSDVRLSTFDEKGKIGVSSNGKISIPRDAPRVVRYQIARFCEWDERGLDTPRDASTSWREHHAPLRSARGYSTTRNEYKYRVTAQSLKHAKEQGLKAEQLLSLLVKHTDNKVPPPLVKALKRWDANGTQARMETQTILRVSQPEVLEEMRKSRAGKFLGEILSPTAVVVKSGAIQKVMEAMIELGLFADIEE